eukprot:1188258-Pyramimonas_sp.AAC.1
MAIAVLSIFALMKLVFFNQLAAKTTERPEEISSALREWDVIVLAGAHQWGGPEPMKKTSRRYHTASQFGARKGQWRTNSCGRAFLVSNEMMKDKAFLAQY